MTHERTIQTLKWALVLIPFALMALLILTGCGAASPTASTETGTRELRMLQYLQCFADHHGLEGQVALQLFDEKRAHCDGQQTAGGPLPYTIAKAGGCGVVVCAAWPGSRSVECWRPWINGDTEYLSGDTEFREAASHEVCHLTGIWDEGDASACAMVAIEKGACQ